MGIISRWRAKRQAKKRAKVFSKSAYTITLSGTPAGQTRTTSGALISTPGTPARAGYSFSGGGVGQPTIPTTTQQKQLTTQLQRQGLTKPQSQKITQRAIIEARRRITQRKIVRKRIRSPIIIKRQFPIRKPRRENDFRKGVRLGLEEAKALRKKQKEELKLSKDTQRIFKNLEKRGWSKDRIASLLSIRPEAIDKNLRFLSEKKRSKLKKLSGFQKNVIIGALESIEKEPEKVIVVGVASSVLPSGLAVLRGAKVTSKVLKRIPKPIRKKGGKILNKALGGLYLASSGLQIARQPTPELRAKKVGNILTTEVIPFTIGTKLGVRGLLRVQVKGEMNKEISKLPRNKRRAFKEYMNQAEVLGKFEPKANNIKLNNIESIKGSKAQKAIRKFLKKNDIVVGGSVAQTGQVKIKRKLGDMDLYIEGKTSPSGMAKRLASQLKKAGVKRVSNIRGQVTLNGKKAIEFHDIERLKRNIEEVIPTWQNANKYIIKTPEGIKIQRVGLQARRKLIAGFVDPKRLATGKYKKDLKDFKLIADQLLKKAELNARTSFFSKTKKKVKIKRFKKPKRFVVKPSSRKKVGVGIKKPPKKISRKIKIKKPRKKVISKRRIPSQKKVKIKKPRRIIPSQLPRKKPKKKKFVPSQPPTKKKPKKRKVPPKKPPRKFVPSQPPAIPKKAKKITPFKRVPKPKKVTPTKEEKAIIFKKRKRRFKKKTKKKIGGYYVYARPLKKRGAKKKPKLVKISKVPLKKTRAKDLRNYITDQSLSRTARIKPTKRKARKAKLKVPKSYSKRTRKKFREYRIVKGKRKALVKGKVIERRGRLLDTRSERKGITLKRKLSQMEKISGIKPKKRKIIRRTIKKRYTPTRRKVMLKNLAKARRVRMKQLKGGKK